MSEHRLTHHSFQELDKRGVAYIRSVLADGNPLGTSFLAATDLDSGRVFALLPPGQIGDPYEFQQSIARENPAPRIPTPGGYVQAVASTDDAALVWIDRTFHDHPQLVLVAESYVLRAEFKRPRDPGRVYTHNGFVYYVGLPGDESPLMEACMGCITTVPPGIGFLWSTDQSASSLLRGGFSMNDDHQKSIVRDAQALLVGAYDADSLLVWVPKTTTVAVPALVAT